MSDTNQTQEQKQEQTQEQTQQQQTQISSTQLSINAGEGKQVLIAYILWGLLGFFGIHKFYLGRNGAGIGMIVLSMLSIITFGITGIAVFVWWILDAVKMSEMVNIANKEAGIENPTGMSLQMDKK